MVLVVAKGENGATERFERADQVSRAMLVRIAGKLATETPNPIKGVPTTVTQIGKWKLQSTLAAGKETYTFADWAQVLLACAGKQHTVTVGSGAASVQHTVPANGAEKFVTNCEARLVAEEKRQASLERIDLGIKARNASVATVAKSATELSTQNAFVKSVEGKTLLYQAAYMSGDMFAIGAALKLDSTTRLVILHTKTELEKAKRLLSFYLGQCSESRILLVEVTNSNDAYRGFPDDYKTGTKTTPNVLVELAKAPRVLFKSPGGATSIVAAKRKDGWKGDDLRTAWSPSEAWHIDEIDKFLTSKAVVKNARYLVLWTRFSGKGAAKGGPPGAHPELDIGYNMIRQIVSRRSDFDRRIVIVGPDRGGKLNGIASADPNVTNWGEYYIDVTWTKGLDRAGEYGPFVRMTDATWGCDIVHLGMRSGAMDAAALLGMRTLFVENTDNPQIDRTTKWTGEKNNNPVYERVGVSALPTLTGEIMRKHVTLPYSDVLKVKAQVKAMRADSGTAPLRDQRLQDIADDYVGHVRGLTTGDLDNLVERLK